MVEDTQDFKFIEKVQDGRNIDYHYMRTDGERIKVWWDYNTRFWVVYPIDVDGYQNGTSEYVIKDDIPWAINNVQVQFYGI